MSILGRAELLLQAKNYSGSGNWLDEANSHDAAIFGALFLPYASTQYMYLPGTAGNYASAPDSAALSITGDIDPQARVALGDWTPAQEMAIVSKYIATNDHRSYMFVVRSGSTGLLRFYWSEDGVNLLTGTSSVAPTVSDGDWLWIRTPLDVDGGAGDVGSVTFYTGGSGTSPTWIQLGGVSEAGSAPSSIFDGLHPVEVGAYANGSAGLMQGKVANVRIYSDLTETNLEFDADFTDRSVLTEPFATFIEGSPNAATVTLARSATDHKLTIVDRAMFLLGAGDYFEIADDAGLDFAADEDFTLMTLARSYDVTPAADQVLIAKKGDLTTTTGYALYVDTTGVPKLVIDDGTNPPAEASGPALTDGQMHVIAAVRNTTDDDITVFVDGVAGTPVPDSTVLTLANAEVMRLGASSATAADFVDGEDASDVLWREALTDAEVLWAGQSLQGLTDHQPVTSPGQLLRTGK